IVDSVCFTTRYELLEHIPSRIRREGIPVEDQLVVAAYQIAVADRTLVSACETCHHLVADRRLVQTEWRRAQIYDDLRALLHQAAHRLAIVERSRQVVFRPNVLANRDADFSSVNNKGLDALGRLKISLLVENIVSWQQ